MSTFGIVAITALASLFFLLVLAAAGMLIYQGVLARRQVISLHDEAKVLLEDVRKGLEMHKLSIEQAINKINGDQLSQAAVSILQAAQQNTAAAKRIELAALAIGELIIPAATRRETGLAPEEYAEPEPGERPFISLNRTAALDQAAEAEEERGTIG